MLRIFKKCWVALTTESVVQSKFDEDRVAIDAARDVERALGVFDGLYEPDYLKVLRSEERV